MEAKFNELEDWQRYVHVHVVYRITGYLCEHASTIFMICEKNRKNIICIFLWPHPHLQLCEGI